MRIRKEFFFKYLEGRVIREAKNLGGRAVRAGLKSGWTYTPLPPFNMPRMYKMNRTQKAFTKILTVHISKIAAQNSLWATSTSVLK